MADRLLFGTAGIPLSSATRSTEVGIERIYQLGLGCMEIEFVQGVRMSPPTARSVAEVGKKRGIKLSAHGPYYINLNSSEEDKVTASRLRILQTARTVALCGGEDAVFHPAFYMQDAPAAAYAKVKKNLEQVLAELQEENNHVTVRPELMGKGTQFGTLEELLQLSSELENVLPAIDFAHLHARTGKVNSYHEFSEVLNLIESRLGRKGLDNMLMHVSGIEYTSKGERKHLELQKSDFDYRGLMKALKDRDAKGMVICESPNLEEDAMLLQQTYVSI